MSNTWFVNEQLKTTKVDIESNGGISQPVGKVPVPGTGLKAWALRAFYYIWFMISAHIWLAKQIVFKHRSFNGGQIPNRTGDIAVVTGGARGIGTEIVRKLLIADMTIVIGCRDVSGGWGHIQRLRDEGVKTGTVDCIAVDLESFDSVRAFANRLRQKYSKINVLIHNAGIMLAPYKLTVDGLESHIQINYFSPFLLTLLLMPALINGGFENKFSRIINVSSKCQDLGQIDFDDLLMEKMYSQTQAYNCSKLMEGISSNFLDKRFQENGLKIHSHIVHPGLIFSELFKHQIYMRVFRPIIKLLMQKLDQGADGIVYAALSPEIESEGGLYLSNCKKLQHHKQAVDEDVQRKLWDLSCDLVGMNKNILPTNIV